MIQYVIIILQIPAWAGGTGEGEHIKAALSVVGETPESPPKYYGTHFGSRTAPGM